MLNVHWIAILLICNSTAFLTRQKYFYFLRHLIINCLDSNPLSYFKIMTLFSLQQQSNVMHYKSSLPILGPSDRKVKQTSCKHWDLARNRFKFNLKKYKILANLRKSIYFGSVFCHIVGCTRLGENSRHHWNCSGPYCPFKTFNKSSKCNKLHAHIYTFYTVFYDCHNNTLHIPQKLLTPVRYTTK